MAQRAIVQQRSSLLDQDAVEDYLSEAQIQGSQKQVRWRLSALHQIPNANQPAFFATVLKVFSNAYNFVLLVHSEVKPVEEHQANRTGTQTGR